MLHGVNGIKIVYKFFTKCCQGNMSFITINSVTVTFMGVRI